MQSGVQRVVEREIGAVLDGALLAEARWRSEPQVPHFLKHQEGWHANEDNDEVGEDEYPPRTGRIGRLLGWG